MSQECPFKKAMTGAGGVGGKGGVMGGCGGLLAAFCRAACGHKAPTVCLCILQAGRAAPASAKARVDVVLQGCWRPPTSKSQDAG